VKTPFGEVDLLVLERGGRTVCTEVKTARVADLDRGLDPLLRPGRRYDRTRHARQRSAARWLAARLGTPPGRGGGRVDLVEVLVEAGTGRARFFHHRNVRGPVLPLQGWRGGKGDFGPARGPFDRGSTP
jgi:Holliday junction resolvase-like predicted endonuclease